MYDVAYLSFNHKRLFPSKWSIKEYQANVPSWIRNYFFFIPGIDDIYLLKALHSFMLDEIPGCYHSAYFFDKLFDLLQAETGQMDYQFSEKLFEWYLIYRSLDYGLQDFTKSFSIPMNMYSSPARMLTCRQDSIIKNPTHAQNIGTVRLCSELDFWISMNDESKGGFGRPYGPFEDNDIIHTQHIYRQEAEQLGLLKKNEKIDLSPADRERWCLPLKYIEDYDDPERLQVVEELKKWGVWDIRQLILSQQRPPISKTHEIKLEQIELCEKQYEEELNAQYELEMALIKEEFDFEKWIDDEAKKLYGTSDSDEILNILMAQSPNIPPPEQE